MSDYLELWYKDLVARAPGTIKKFSEAWGECERHTGPSVWYAKVKIAIGNSDELQVVDQLDTNKSKRLRSEGWYDQIIFGVLDVMLTSWVSPIMTFRLEIKDVDIHEVESRPIAFRIAARDAASKMLPSLLRLASKE